jgi:hypothetical protein
VSLDSIPLTWPGEESVENVTAETSEDTGLWSKSRDFDWGD